MTWSNSRIPSGLSGCTNRRAFVLRCAASALCATLSTSALCADDPPLSPSTGGKSITEAALQKGDLILSTTSTATTSYVSATISAAIRLATGNGPVSHAAVYSELGVIDVLISHGVTVRSVSGSLNDASVAVAFRYPKVTSGQQQVINDWAVARLGAGYDFAGLANDVRFQFLGQTHRLVNLGVSASRFYCSRFVIDAYAAASLQLTTTPPNFSSPNDLVPLTWFGELEYIGHLKA